MKREKPIFHNHLLKLSEFLQLRRVWNFIKLSVILNLFQDLPFLVFPHQKFVILAEALIYYSFLNRVIIQKIYDSVRQYASLHSLRSPKVYTGMTNCEYKPPKSTTYDDCVASWTFPSVSPPSFQHPSKGEEIQRYNPLIEGGSEV